MSEKKYLHPDGIDRLRAAVVGQAVKDYLDLCRVKQYGFHRFPRIEINVF